MQLKSICGVILASENPQRLAEFYSQVFAVSFEEEEHGGLDKHYGVDIGEVHLGIHPLKNLSMRNAGHSSISIAYNIDTIKEVMLRLEALNAPQVILPHDEGFGMVASYQDPDGNQFEIVELNYDFGAE